MQDALRCTAHAIRDIKNKITSHFVENQGFTQGNFRHNITLHDASNRRITHTRYRPEHGAVHVNDLTLSGPYSWDYVGKRKV